MYITHLKKEKTPLLSETYQYRERELDSCKRAEITGYQSLSRIKDEHAESPNQIKISA